MKIAKRLNSSGSKAAKPSAVSPKHSRIARRVAAKFYMDAFLKHESTRKSHEKSGRDT